MFTTRYRRGTEGGRVVLYCSDDGILWKEVPDSEVLGTGGPSAAGRWDSGWLYVLKGLVPLDGDKVAVPYLGTAYPHKYPRWEQVVAGTQRFAWAYWEADRLVAVRADELGGFCSRSVVPAGRTLRINAPHRPVGLRAGGDRGTARGPGARHAPTGLRHGSRHRAADRELQAPQRRLPLADRRLERANRYQRRGRHAGHPALRAAPRRPVRLRVGGVAMATTILTGEPYALAGTRLAFTSWYYVRVGGFAWIDAAGDNVTVAGNAAPDEAAFVPKDRPSGIRLRAEGARACREPIIEPDSGVETAVQVGTILQRGFLLSGVGHLPPPRRIDATRLLRVHRRRELDTPAPGRRRPRRIARQQLHRGVRRVCVLRPRRRARGTVQGDRGGLHHSGAARRVPAATARRIRPAGDPRRAQGGRPLVAWQQHLRRGRLDLTGRIPLAADGHAAGGHPFRHAHRLPLRRVPPQVRGYFREWYTGPRAEGIPNPDPLPWKRAGRRAISRAETDDFRRFPMPETVLIPRYDMHPADQLYTNCRTAIPRAPDHHLMFPAVYVTRRRHHLHRPGIEPRRQDLELRAGRPAAGDRHLRRLERRLRVRLRGAAGAGRRRLRPAFHRPQRPAQVLARPVASRSAYALWPKGRLVGSRRPNGASSPPWPWSLRDGVCTSTR